MIDGYCISPLKIVEAAIWPDQISEAVGFCCDVASGSFGSKAWKRRDAFEESMLHRQDIIVAEHGALCRSAISLKAALASHVYVWLILPYS